jgi:2'-5' RNA ligase
LPETALICRVPEAEPFISHYRERYDPPARRRVPAHVTVLYPFMPPQHVDAGVVAELARIAAGVSCFDYRLRETRRFPVSLYLAPEPDRPFSALTDAVHRSFPDYPPFAGKFEVVVPHVTVAHADEAKLCEIEIELRIALATGGGVRARCSEMILIEDTRGHWEEMHCFALGSQARP